MIASHPISHDQPLSWEWVSRLEQKLKSACEAAQQGCAVRVPMAQREIEFIEGKSARLVDSGQISVLSLIKLADDCYADFPSMTLVVNSRRVSMRRRLWLLLAIFVQYPNTALSFEQLERYAQIAPSRGKRFPKAVSVSMSHLRQKLGPIGGLCIQTVRCYGYIFVPPYE